jgi:fatty-acyl-CoA synthase
MQVQKASAIFGPEMDFVEKESSEDGLMKSYVCGISDKPLIYKTVGEVFDDCVQTWGDREGLRVCHQDIRWTYRELGAAVDQFAAGLVALGLQAGDRVGIWSPNNAEWVITQFATAKAGLVLVNINPAYRLSELEYSLNNVGCRALITARRFKSSDYLQMLNSLAPELPGAKPGELRARRLPDLETVIVIGDDSVPGCFGFDQVAAMAEPRALSELAIRAGSMQPDDAINIQFTSGTTGTPKGATLTHFNIVNNAYFSGRGMNFTEQDRLCIPVPLYHCFGMVLSVLTCVTHGAAMIFPDEAFEPESVLRAVAEERCTALHGVPTMFIAELGHPNFGAYNLSSLRTGIMAGASCPIEIMKRVVDSMCMPQVTICYGMTETSPVSFQSCVDDPLDKRVGTVGRVHPHVQVKIIDESGRVVPRGQKGELCTRGYCLMQGYWGDPEKTRDAIDECGWLHSGDLAVLDDQGYCNIVGRVKDMIIRGGENVYPREIEEFLFRHPKVQDVAVFGIPDEKFGEQIAAWIKLKEGEVSSAEEIREFCREQIAYYKVPHRVEFVDVFPMTVTGKIQKFVMRQEVMSRLDLREQVTA